MSEPKQTTIIKGRVQSKTDTTARWDATTNFIPLKGEIIIYSDYYYGNQPGVKIGDGIHKVQDLKFIGFEATYSDEQINEILGYALEDTERYVNTFFNSQIKNNLDKNYVHYQNTASDIWQIEHNLDKFPSITVLDSANTEVTGDITHISLNKATIKFTNAFSGTAYCN